MLAAMALNANPFRTRPVAPDELNPYKEAGGRPAPLSQQESDANFALLRGLVFSGGLR